MPPDPLLPDPADLEDRLARRSCPEPAADFRARVLSAVAGARDQPAAQRPGRRWRLWQAAAAVILALNVGMSAANGIRFHRLAATAAAAADERRPAEPGVPDA